MHVGTSQGDAQRYPLLIDMEMGFTPTASPISGVTPQGLIFEADGLTPHGGLH